MADFVRQPPIAYGYDIKGNPIFYIILGGGEKARLMTAIPPKLRLDLNEELDKEKLKDLK